MCNDCCKEFTGWSKAFTKTELFLCVLQAVFLIVFIAFLTFLILHLVVCSKNIQKLEVVSQAKTNQTSENINVDKTTVNIIKTDYDTVHQNKTVTENINEEAVITVQSKSIPTLVSTLDEAVKCTWTPAQKTKALTHYYEVIQTSMMTKTLDEHVVENHNTKVPKQFNTAFVETELHKHEDNKLLLEDLSQGNEIQDSRKDSLLALIKINPLQGINFACTLTIISEYWCLTAASCIEEIAEVDSLDSFVMLQGFEEKHKNIHPVAVIMTHPQYQGVNVSYDLAAVKSENSLVRKGGLVVKLPRIIDYLILTIGERLTVLGYGQFRSMDKDPRIRSVREVSVHSRPLSQCSAAPKTCLLRLRDEGSLVVHGSRGTCPLCLGVLRSRTLPCFYCSGTPLLKRNVLLGIMSDNKLCGLSCKPTLFVNLAEVSEWLSSVLMN